MAQQETYLTEEGLGKIEAELEHLRTVRRQEVAKRIQKSKEIGGTVDNAEYDEAKNEQAFVEGRILTLEGMARNAVLIPGNVAPSKVVQLGSTVTVTGKGKAQTYVIVGRVEADPSQGKISNESPVGKALIGLKSGGTATVETPSGTVKLKVMRIK